MSTKILLIDDEDVFREDLATLLTQRGFDCRTADCGEAGLVVAAEWSPAVIFCDISMPGMDGLMVLDEILRLTPQAQVIMITAFGAMDTAIEAFRKGASDYILKPIYIDEVTQRINRLIDYQSLAQEVRCLRRTIGQEGESPSIVGNSDAMRGVLDLVAKVAPTHSTVLISGESGTGKELIARAIHQQSEVDEHPFVAINCAGIPDNLLESELFGHVRGAFTGAIADRAGFFELAARGTILLDEIAEMPLPLQGKLLRALEEREFVRVGDNKPVSFHARIVAATNQNLRVAVDEGQFREDLFFRVAVFEIHLPPLRERRADIPSLAEHYVRVLSQEMKKKCLGLDNQAVRNLMAYDWPGNIRELKNAIERALILQTGDTITAADLPAQVTGAEILPGVDTDNLKEVVSAFEKAHIERVLASCDGNKEEAARRMGVNPSTLYRKMTSSETAQQPVLGD